MEFGAEDKTCGKDQTQKGQNREDLGFLVRVPCHGTRGRQTFAEVLRLWAHCVHGLGVQENVLEVKRVWRKCAHPRRKWNTARERKEYGRSPKRPRKVCELNYVFLSKPRKRKHTMVFPQTKGGTTEVGFLLVSYRITFEEQDFFPSSPTCLDLPRLA